MIINAFESTLFGLVPLKKDKFVKEKEFFFMNNCFIAGNRCYTTGKDPTPIRFCKRYLHTYIFVILNCIYSIIEDLKAHKRQICIQTQNREQESRPLREKGTIHILIKVPSC